MDCALSSWPSITQFDDFSWAGLGDIDPLENLDQSFDNEPGASFTDLQETKPSKPANTLPCSETVAEISHVQNDELYRLSSSESLVAARWESMNGVDLASVLDSTFPSNGDTATPSAEDVYTLYSDSILSDMDAFMSDSVSEVAGCNTGFLSNEDTSLNATLTPEMVSLPESKEIVKCESGVVDGDSTGSINISHVGTSSSVATRGDCSSHPVDRFDCRGVLRVNVVQPYPVNSMSPPVCGDPCTSSQCASDLKESIPPHGHDHVRPGMVMSWPTARSTCINRQVFDREKVLNPSTLHVGNNYSATIDQQVRLADAASVELKRNRAQASRARRLAANQRRAKKYPLQKLIRMSSSPTSTRDRLEQNLAGALGTLNPPVHMVSPGQFPGSVQSLSRNTLNATAPNFLPVVLQNPHLASSHELYSQPNPMQGCAYYRYQQTSVISAEDTGVSSGSGAMQSMCTDQDAQSLSSTLTPAFSRSTNSTHCLDAALLEQLQTILSKMNVNVRLCIRDALYRLANSAKHRQSRNDPALDSNSSHSGEAMETNTNSIDRWIVNILFCKQDISSALHSQQRPPTLSQVSSQFLENYNSSSSSQQWNSCGSSVNLQEQPLHVVTGL